MANVHSNLVRGEICGEVGKGLGLSDFIVVGHSEQKKGVNLIVSVVGDVVEALITHYQAEVLKARMRIFERGRKKNNPRNIR